MIKRLSIIAAFYLFDGWLLDMLCRHVFQWLPAPGRVLEGAILLGGLLLFVGLMSLQVWSWYKFKLHLPDKPKRSWESTKQSFRLPGQQEPPPTVAQERVEFNHTIIILPILLVLTFARPCLGNPDLSFVNAVESEYYLTADICHNILKAKPNRAQALCIVLTEPSTEEAKTRKVEYLLSKGADPNYPKKSMSGYTTPLSLATRPEFSHLLPLLLKHCKKIETHSEVLSRPVRDGDVEMVRLLLKHGAEVNLADPISDRTPLHWAACPMHENKEVALEIAELLLQAGAQVNAVQLEHYPPYAQTALDRAECDPDFPAMAELLRRHGGKRAQELIAEYYKEKQRN